MRIDCHFHPNFSFFSKFLIKSKAKKIFKQFTKHKLDAVIVTEHVFKKPYQSFKRLKQLQPKDSKTMLIPGVEAVTKEGIDVIVFSATEYIYEKKEIMTTWCLSIKDLLQQVAKDKNLHAIIPHPFLPNQQGLFKAIGYKEAKNILKEIKLFEKHNDCFTPLIDFLHSTKIEKLMPSLKAKLKKVHTSPNLKGVNALFTGGSDAHHPWNIGSHLQLNCTKPHSVSNAIYKLLSVKDRQMHFVKTKVPHTVDLVINGITALSELCILKFKKSHIDLKTSYHEQCKNLHQGRREFSQIKSQV